MSDQRNRANGPGIPAASVQTFVEDIFLVRRAGDRPLVYRLTEAFWKALPTKTEEDLEHAETAGLLPLIRNEVVLAEVPARSDNEAGYAFVNLTTLAVNRD